MVTRGAERAPAEKTRHTAEQRDAVLAALEEYHPTSRACSVSTGHTEPQYVIPSEREICVDAKNRTVEVTY